MTRSCRSAGSGVAIADPLGLRYVLLLLPLLFTRSLAGFAASKNSAKLAAAGGTFGPPGLAEPTEVDLLDDSDPPKDMPSILPRVQAPEPEREPEEAGLFLSVLTGERAWMVLSFGVGYGLVQYFLSKGDTAECVAAKKE
ncbi:unnamed protein product [Symbiodinium natans]|uniref:Uncharacterized protein n=1 Tax=Symbiodinium natans TaxID=878477 RepID=A0A812TJZ2_9DINO|nr:unnamed protein product [Symbiodinium natans]